MNFTTLALLIVALILLWLAVTNQLNRALDAWDVLTGAKSASATGALTTKLNGLTVTLPSLPALGSPATVSL